MLNINNMIRNNSNSTSRRTRSNFFNVNKHYSSSTSTSNNNNHPKQISRQEVQNIVASCLYLAAK